ncbi:MAG: hypothetical protein H6620_12565 [Halobacteriovoraceae bacterium]|nr:hypothetical protein [Halobacteriovoraceae bacterium]
MNVPNKVMAVRSERASHLEAFARLMDKYELCETGLIYKAAKVLRDKTKAFHSPNTKDYSCWGYKINDLPFYLAELPKRHIRPSTIHSMQLEVDIELLCNDEHWKYQSDPFIELNFRVRVIGSDSRKKYAFGFHVDKHKHKQQHESEEIHPIYHLQYNPIIGEDEETDLGSILYLDSPRMMHVPVDLILGTDLILSNFVPRIWNKLRDENEYQSLYQKYQNSLWKPYIHTWASHWPYKLQELNWKRAQL